MPVGRAPAGAAAPHVLHADLRERPVDHALHRPAAGGRTQRRRADAGCGGRAASRADGRPRPAARWLARRPLRRQLPLPGPEPVALRVQGGVAGLGRVQLRLHRRPLRAEVGQRPDVVLSGGVGSGQRVVRRLLRPPPRRSAGHRRRPARPSRPTRRWRGRPGPAPARRARRAPSGRRCRCTLPGPRGRPGPGRRVGAEHIVAGPPKNRACDSSPHTAQAARVGGQAFAACAALKIRCRRRRTCSSWWRQAMASQSGRPSGPFTTSSSPRGRP